MAANTEVNMLKFVVYNARKAGELVFKLLLLCALAGHAAAEIIDDISLRTDANGEIDAIIKFTVPVHYVRHFPVRKSLDLEIYFNIIGGVPPDEWQNYWSHVSPPSDHVLGFTITTRDLNTGPRIEVHFKHPSEFSVRPGNTDRSIVLHIKPEQVQKKKEDKPELDKPAAAAPPAVVPIQPPAAAIPPGLPAASPQTAPARLDGKDGFPAFPRIEQVAPEVLTAQPAEQLTLAEGIKRANDQAAVWMAKGRDALLAREVFAAIEAFNNVLKLPPNKYSPDAQIWIGIARERSGQPAKAIIEYELYLKLYPDGAEARWVNERMSNLKKTQPSLTTATPYVAPVETKKTEWTTKEYGSLSMYYYHGASQTDTVATIGNVQTPSRLTLVDQSSLISNVNMTVRSYNSTYDTRFVFQDFYAASFLPGHEDRNRLNAVYYELKSRVDNYSARVGRQSATGGGVLGRFDGISAGYGFLPDWRVNVVTGRLSDPTPEARPTFLSAGLDFGVNSPLGGSVYLINQKAEGFAERKATGANLRFFEPGMTALLMLDYDLQFDKLNIFTLQETWSLGPSTDYNILVDHRRTPSLSVRNAVTGTTATVNSLRQNGWTQDDLLMLAKKRTATSNLVLLGVTKRIEEKWQIGTDFFASNTSGMPASGTLIPDGTTGLEGYLPATEPSGTAWTVNGRVSGSDVISNRDTSVCSVSYSRAPTVEGKTLLLYNHAYMSDLWMLDTTLRFAWQTDNAGGKVNTTAPVLKVGYRIRNNLALEAERGIDWTSATPAALPGSKTTRHYFSFGFRVDF
jgi:hypothetical protein